MADDLCTCGRRRCTNADLERWTAEFGIDARVPEPEWAKVICWTKPGVKCGMKPLSTTQG